MSVYVDPIRTVVPTKKWHFKSACHMFADALFELHEVAGLIGLSRSCFQDDADFPHYDLTEAKRRQAIARGAVEVGERNAVAFARKRRMERMMMEERPELWEPLI